MKRLLAGLIIFVVCIILSYFTTMSFIEGGVPDGIIVLKILTPEGQPVQGASLKLRSPEPSTIKSHSCPR